MHPILFKIGPITIRTYGFFIFLGVLSGYLICKKRAKELRIDPDKFSNLFFWTLVTGFIGARLVYIIVNWQNFLQAPLNLILNRSGFVFYGGVIFGIFSIFLFSKKYKIKFLKITDIFALGTPLAHGLGRIGCFFHGCCYGKSTESWLGIQFPPSSPVRPIGEKVIPTQLISAGFLLLLFLFLYIIRDKVNKLGKLTSYYLLIYASFRYIIESFRGDTERGFMLIFSTSQWLSLLLIILAIFILNKKPKEIQDGQSDN